MNCPPSPPNKKEYINAVGKELVSTYGKKQYYKPEEVKKAAKRTKYSDTSALDWVCWAMSTFSSHSDFDSYHEAKGEACDYTSMKTEVLASLGGVSSIDLQNSPGIDMDASLVDFGEASGGVLEGIGDFISGLFDGF